MKKQSQLFIGTSGWKYKHWNNVFYPADLKQKDQLQYYYGVFNTVELNNSFYRTPPASNFTNWKESVPEDFIFAVKGNRFSTHLKKLNVLKDDILSFLDKTANLENTLGPVLFQLPPKWQLNVERLARFLEMLPQSFRYTFEFRNHTWYTQEVYDLLSQYNCAFCIYDLAGHLSPMEVTADFVYVRLHGPGDKYQGSYTQKELNKWATFCMEQQQTGKDVYVYFDNDQAGYAAFNAIDLKKIVDTI